MIEKKESLDFSRSAKHRGRAKSVHFLAKSSKIGDSRASHNCSHKRDALPQKLRGLDVRFLIDEIPKLKAIFLLPSLKFPFFSFFAPFHLLAPFFCSNLFSDDEIDIVISHGTYTCFLAKRATKNKKIRYVPFIHDPAAFILKKVYGDKFLGKLNFVLDPLARWLDQFLLNGSSFVLTQSYVHKPYLSAIRSQQEVKVINMVLRHQIRPRSTSP